MDLLLYGDSIFESFLGNLMGQPNADWAGVADVWNKHHGGSKAKVLAISGMSMLQQQHMHAAAAALIMCRSCAVPIMCSAWLDHDHAYSSRRCISLHVTLLPDYEPCIHYHLLLQCQPACDRKELCGGIECMQP